jgi:hypothetical protein
MPVRAGTVATQFFRLVPYYLSRQICSEAPNGLPAMIAANADRISVFVAPAERLAAG